MNPDIISYLQQDERVSFEIVLDGTKYCAAKTRPCQPALNNAGDGRLESMVGMRCHGWIKSFKGDWGFINSNFFQGDLFVGARENPRLQNMQSGDIVEFDVNKKGSRIEAINVVVGGMGMV